MQNDDVPKDVTDSEFEFWFEHNAKLWVPDNSPGPLYSAGFSSGVKWGASKAWNAAPNPWCHDMEKAPKNTRLMVYLESDNFGPAEIVEIRSLRNGPWVGFEGEQWANDHGGIRTMNPVYSAWRYIDQPAPQETKNAE